ncbi:hypothetical protein Dxin01_01325 [Deinococcus xinjiangensis]|uniref:Uncharacterized protein n=1 Tax=Deinococcus xinjiangensis TaxID=457454 RepID=A0ABP9V8K0_9DEIO
MNPQQLRLLILSLPKHQPITAEAIKDKIGGWSDEQAHLEGWLSDYDGSGFYNRAGHGHDVKHFYQRFQDGYGLLWLAEALGVNRSIVERGAAAIREKHDQRPGTIAAAFRKVCPWSLIEERLKVHAHDAERVKKAPLKQIEGQNTGQAANKFLDGLD